MRQKPANLRLIADKQATFPQQLGGYAPAGDEMPGEAAVINLAAAAGRAFRLQNGGAAGKLPGQLQDLLGAPDIGIRNVQAACRYDAAAAASLTVVRMMGAELTYFTWHFTLLPVFLCIIPLILITAIVPLVCYNKMAQKTVVERLRIAE